MTIEADVQSAAILVVTDGYARGWRAAALGGSVQDNYDVLPADHALRAIPLTAGRHHLRLEYLPVAFTAGFWVTLASLLAFVVAFGRWCVTRSRPADARSTADS